jgi:hypothetical protein
LKIGPLEGREDISQSNLKGKYEENLGRNVYKRRKRKVYRAKRAYIQRVAP